MHLLDCLCSDIRPIIYVGTLVVATSACTVAPQNAPEFVSDCQPCMVDLDGGIGLVPFFFETGMDVYGEPQVTLIRVAPGGRPVPAQILRPTKPATALPTLGFYFSAEDINFDGYNDLVLMTMSGAANSYADYWIFDAESRRFAPIGNYPMFTRDLESKHLHTYERVGTAGLEYRTGEYAIRDGRPELIRFEEQIPTDRPDQFRRVVQERRNGKMVIIDDQTIYASE